MLVWFNNKGIVKEQLDSYGNLPRVGSQLFKIFAYFDGIELENYGAAYIRLTRPDLGDSEYPVLFMAKADLTYENNISDSPSRYFTVGGGPNEDHSYPCYLFDFSKIVNSDLDSRIVTLLDTPGLWQCTITLISTSSSATNVVGTLTFEVGGAADSEEETELDFSVVAQNIATVVATKLNVDDVYWLRACSNFITKAGNGTLLKSYFTPGAYIFNETDKCVYKILTTTDSTEGYVSATYRLILDFAPYHRIVVVENIDNLSPTVIQNQYQIGQIFYCLTKKEYYYKTSSSSISLYDHGIAGSARTILRYEELEADTVTLEDVYYFAGYRSLIFCPYSSNADLKTDYLMQFKKLSSDNNPTLVRLVRLSDLRTWEANIENLADGIDTLVIDILVAAYENDIATHKFVNDALQSVFNATSSSMNLNASQLEYLERTDSRILYQGYYYERSLVEDDKIYFEPTFLSLATSASNSSIVKKLITIDTTESTLTASEEETEFYDKDVLDQDFSTKAEVPQYQMCVAIIKDTLTNINDRSLTAYESTLTTISGYPCYKITYGGENLTKAQASAYLEFMCGSKFLPEYDYEKPKNSILMLPNGQMLKPQWDNTHGLLLYKMKRLADTDYVDNMILTLSSAGGTLTDEQYEYILRKNARVYYSTVGVYYEKYEENSTRILLKAINIGIDNNNGVVTITNTPALQITKATKRYAFGAGVSQQFYNKSKLDSDFATKDYVDQAIENVKQNSLQNVDTTEYPTLQDFLDSEGEEGYIYLYPIDQSDLTKGYYRYIWEYIPADDAYEWEYLGTTEIDLSNFEVTFEQLTFNDGVISVTFKNNTDYQLVSLVDAITVGLIIPSDVSQGWIGSCTFQVGNSIPTFSLTNNSSYNVVFIVNNRKADVSGISLNLDVNGIVECLAECNGFDIRVYMKEVTN